MTLPTIPLFVQHLGGNDQMIGIITGVFTFSALLFRPNAGHSLESVGRKFVYMLGLGIFVLSVGSFAFISSVILLFFLFVVFKESVGAIRQQLLALLQQISFHRSEEEKGWAISVYLVTLHWLSVQLLVCPYMESPPLRCCF